MRHVFLFMGLVVAGVAPVSAHADEPWRLGTSLESPTGADDEVASLSFTPRVPGVFDLDSARVTLSYAPLVRDEHTLGGGTRAVDGFSVGGALAIDRFMIEGAMARETSARVEHERIDAAIGFGGFTTRMHLQDSEGVSSGDASTRFGIGADLDAAPGLSLGAGLNFAESDDGAEDDTSGVVRFRLQF